MVGLALDESELGSELGYFVGSTVELSYIYFIQCRKWNIMNVIKIYDMHLTKED